MKNSNDTIGSRTRDLPVCSAVPQPNGLPRAPQILYGPAEYFAGAFLFMLRVCVVVIVIKTVSRKNVVRSTERSPMRTCSLLVTVSFFPSIVSLSCFRHCFAPIRHGKS